MKRLAATLALVCLALAGPAHAQRRGATNEIESGTTTNMVCTNLSQAEFQQMAEQLFGRIFTDEAFIEVAGDTRPSVVIGDVVNDSHSYLMETDVMFNSLRNVIVASRAVRLFAPGADADITIASQLTSTYLRGDRGATQSNFTLNVTLTRLNGEYLGAWDVNRAFRC
ncbi:MAG: hypothetical protein JNL81_07935 [Hyphomonadaceae bacterium]|nr:hypothetical protein [Hyphomonadaceae bacterium]